MKTIYLNFSNLNEEAKEDIISKAIEDIKADDEEMEYIIEMYPGREDEVVRERAERKLYNYDYVFNV